MSPDYDDDDLWKETVGVRLKDARIAAGLTLRSLAAKVGCSHAALCYAEQGRTTLRMPLLRRVCATLGITVAEVFDRGINATP